MNYCKVTFEWLVLVDMPSDTPELQVIDYARQQVRDVYATTDKDGNLELGELFETVYTHKPEYKLRSTVSVWKDVEILDTQGTHISPWSVSFKQESVVQVCRGKDEDDYIYEAYQQIITELPTLESILGEGDYLIINMEESPYEVQRLIYKQL